MNIRRLIRYINPISRLGKRKYHSAFPLVGGFLVYAFTEAIIHVARISAETSSLIVIAVSLTAVIYFAFHSGIKGGIIADALTVGYYFFYIITRHYHGPEFNAGVETTVFLGLVYLLVGGLIGWLKQTVDKLIEREAEGRRRLQSVISQLPVGIAIADSSGKIVEQNNRLQEILGYRLPEDTLIGQTPVYSNIKPDQAPLALAIKQGKTTKGKDLNITKNGKTSYLTVSAAPIKNRTGKIVAGVSVIDDITQEKQLEKRKDDFINIASHELKTPITSMKLYVEILLKKMGKSNNAELLKTLTSVKYQTERLQELVTDLLDVSRLDTGKMVFNREEFRLDSLVSEIVEELRPSTKEHEIIIDKRPVNVLADKFRIYQVVTNLLTNAIKYSPKGQRIIVKVKQTGKQATVSVQDFGIGIPKGELRKIFDRLYQVSEDEERTFPGFGMGLYISREIINRHHGKIWAESIKGKGSTFFFNLPIKQ